VIPHFVEEGEAFVLTLLVSMLLLFIFLEIPVSFSIGLSSLLYLLINDFPTALVAQRSVLGTYSFPFLALPFFILAGGLMEYGGISRRLLRLSSALVGHIRGGLAVVTVVASLLFGTLSGSAIGSTAAIGSIMIPAMKKKGYVAEFTAALMACSGVLSSMIPPSLTKVILGATAGISIGALFIAAVVPGIITALGLIIVSLIISKRRGYGGEERASLKELLAAAVDSILPMLAPVIMLGGVWGGIFTVTESAIICVVYTLFLGAVVYKEIKIQDFFNICYKTVLTTISVSLIIGLASLFAWIVAAERMPQMMASWFLSISDSKWVFLILVNILVLLLGTFMETSALILILIPIFMPIAKQYGIDAIHFSVVFLVNLCIGANTPPLGVTLMTASKIAEVSYTKATIAVMPFILSTVIVLFICTFIPELSTWLPKIFFGGR